MEQADIEFQMLGRRAQNARIDALSASMQRMKARLEELEREVRNLRMALTDHQKGDQHE